MKKFLGFYVVVITNKKLQMLECYQITSVEEYDMHKVKLYNGQWAKVNISLYNNGYKFVFDASGICMGVILNSIRRTGENWVKSFCPS